MYVIQFRTENAIQMSEIGLLHTDACLVTQYWHQLENYNGWWHTFVLPLLFFVQKYREKE